MCNRAAQQASEAHLVHELGASFFAVGRRPLTLPRPRIVPTDAVPIVADDGDGLVAMDAVWGMPFAGATWNARDDRLESSPAWSRLAGHRERHAVAVLSHVFEALTPDALAAIGVPRALEVVGRDAVAAVRAGHNVWHGVRRIDGRPILVPCLRMEQAGRQWVTMITTRANDVWAALHRPHDTPHETRQVAWLDGVAEATAWLEPEQHDWRGLLRACPPHAMAVHRVAPDGWKGGDPFAPWAPHQAGLDAFA